jgi:hypothetical protein
VVRWIVMRNDWDFMVWSEEKVVAFKQESIQYICLNRKPLRVIHPFSPSLIACLDVTQSDHVMLQIVIFIELAHRLEKP